jgi:hypothetical protein
MVGSFCAGWAQILPMPDGARYHNCYSRHAPLRRRWLSLPAGSARHPQSSASSWRSRPLASNPSVRGWHSMHRRIGGACNSRHEFGLAFRVPLGLHLSINPKQPTICFRWLPAGTASKDSEAGSPGRSPGRSRGFVEQVSPGPGWQHSKACTVRCCTLSAACLLTCLLQCCLA